MDIYKKFIYKYLLYYVIEKKLFFKKCIKKIYVSKYKLKYK